MTVLLPACADAATRAEVLAPLTAVARDSAGIRVITLSSPPAGRWPDGVRLTAEPVRGADSIEFGAVVDLAVLPDGTVAALDDRLKRIFLIQPDGDVRRLSREGEGPGELGTTLALEALDSLLLVWQLPRVNPHVLFILDGNGRVVDTGHAPVAGDWVRVTARYPKVEIDGLQRTTEDVTRRVAAVGDSAFLFVIETDEHDPSLQGDVTRRQASVLLIDTTLTVRDTLAVLAPTTTRRKVDGVAPFPLFEQPLYSARTLVAGGAGWYAIGHGSRDYIEVFASDRHPIARIAWPASQRPIDAAERRAGAGWMLSLRVINSEGSARMYRETSALQRRSILKEEAGTLTNFAEKAPSAAGILGAGTCLFIQNFDAANHPLGAGSTIAAIDVASGVLHGPFVIDGPTGGESADQLEDRTFITIRAATRDALFAIRRESSGAQSLLKYRLPNGMCG